MAFDGIVTKAVIAELQSCLLDGKINKVFEPTKNDIILGIYAQGKNYALQIGTNSTNCRIHLTTHTKPNPIQAPNFCMFLRKHIIGYRIKSISTQDLDRIITIDLEGYNELNDLVCKHLIVELMGKHSNVILVNSNSIILDSLRHIDSATSFRTILPAHPYVPIVSNKHSLLTLESFDEFDKYIQNSDTTLDKTISEFFTGISRIFIQYLLNKLSISTNHYTKEDLKSLFSTLKNVLNHIGTNQLTCLPFEKDYVLDVLPNTNLGINFFLDDFYFLKEESEHFITYRNTILRLLLEYLKKYQKRLSNINSKLAECSHMEEYRLYGELLTANLYRIKNENIDCITLENYYQNNELLTIPLDKSLTPSNNAKKFFKKYSKLKNTLEIVNQQKEETLKEICYLESIVYELENSQNLTDVDTIYNEMTENLNLNTKKVSPKDNKKKTKDKELSSPIEYRVDGYLLLVGKNNKQNDFLTLKLAHKNDLWFHTKDIQGSHAILKTNGEEISQTILEKCACITALHSKAKNSSNVPVDYTFVRNVKKPSGAKPGMVVYVNYKTLYVTPPSNI